MFWRFLTGSHTFDLSYWLTRLENQPENLGPGRLKSAFRLPEHRFGQVSGATLPMVQADTTRELSEMKRWHCSWRYTCPSGQSRWACDAAFVAAPPELETTDEDAGAAESETGGWEVWLSDQSDTAGINADNPAGTHGSRIVIYESSDILAAPPGWYAEDDPEYGPTVIEAIDVSRPPSKNSVCMYDACTACCRSPRHTGI